MFYIIKIVTFNYLISLNVSIFLLKNLPKFDYVFAQKNYYVISG